MYLNAFFKKLVSRTLCIVITLKSQVKENGERYVMIFQSRQLLPCLIAHGRTTPRDIFGKQSIIFIGK